MLKQLKIYYILISLPFAMLLIGAAIFFDAIKSTLIRNPHPQINYTIFVIILAGGVFIIINARRLVREAEILVEFTKAIHAKTDAAALQKMANSYTGDIACLLQIVATSGDRFISHQEQAALEHELSNARTRLNRRNALPQYLTGMLVGMGLLGTFIGLLATLNDISILISSFADIDMNNAHPIEVFRIMIERMKAPMQSMGIAFSASLFGLLGSIILGLMMVGTRRLEGDVFSLLSSEVARHIETALSFENNIAFKNGTVPAGDLSTKVLLRIEERLAEAARVQQRSLSTEIDDFNKQRADMVRALTEQTESSNNFRSELQLLNNQLSTFFNSMAKGSSEVSTQLSELMAQMDGDTKKTHKLLAMQVNEQKGLKRSLDTDKADLLRTIIEQTESNNNFRAELQRLGSQLNTIFNEIDKSNGAISTQLSEMTVHSTTDAKQSQLLLNNVGNHLVNQLGSVAKVIEKSNGSIASQLTKMMIYMAEDAKKSQTLLAQLGNKQNG